MPRKRPGRRGEVWELKTRLDLLTPILEAKHDEMAKDIKQVYYSIDKIYERVAEILDRFGVHSQLRLLYRSYAERLWQITNKYTSNTRKNMANAITTIFSLFGADEQILKEIALLFNLKVEVVVGVGKLSELIIDVDKDWGGHIIKNLGDPVDPYDSARKTEVDAVQTNLDNHSTATGGVHGVPAGEYILPSGEKGAANGIAPLDANALVPIENIPQIPISKIKIGTGTMAAKFVSAGSYLKLTMNRASFFPDTAHQTYTHYFQLRGYGASLAGVISRFAVYNASSSGYYWRHFWEYLTSSRKAIVFVLYTKDGSEHFWVSEPNIDESTGKIIKPIEMRDADDSLLDEDYEVYEAEFFTCRDYTPYAHPDHILKHFLQGTMKTKKIHKHHIIEEEELAKQQIGIEEELSTLIENWRRRK